MMRRAALGVVLWGTCSWGHGAADYELKPAEYSKAGDKNGVTALAKSLPDLLKRRGAKESLKWVLGKLDVPVDSQMLVFSKTSEQNPLIHPRNPRAIYFSEDYYIGYVPGGVIELIAVDDPSGPMFYTFDPRQGDGSPGFVRDRSCLRCHASARTQDVPGMLVRSVHADQDGQLALQWGSYLTLPSSPLKERWGGWYVTGTHGDAQHMGNKVTKKLEDGTYQYQFEHGQNVESLDAYVDLNRHLTDTSDIVALMVMEHQIAVHNTFYSAMFGYQRAAFLQRALHPDEYPEDNAQLKRLEKSYSDAVLRAILMVDHVALPVDGVDGSAAFQEAFKEAGVRSVEGWSLRDLRLQKRLFKYRCSYMVHSAAFGHLPLAIREQVLERLYQHLNHKAEPGFPELSERERERIHAILHQSIAGYPGGVVPK
ncbi:hypothetical protein ACFSW8_09905 [Rubritalea tangerina]|uniref:Cytochrome c domain-containing protein n=2 Tax=Rubritalea tangerina TaxID=430798 RepID=A0ABW4ZCG1_9BACT